MIVLDLLLTPLSSNTPHSLHDVTLQLTGTVVMIIHVLLHLWVLKIKMLFTDVQVFFLIHYIIASHLINHVYIIKWFDQTEILWIQFISWIPLSECCLTPTQQFFSYRKLLVNQLMKWSICTRLSRMFIVRAHWNHNPRIDMSLQSDTLSWFRANQSLHLLLNASCK